MPPKGPTKSQSKEPTKTPQKTKAESKAAATPSKTPKQTPQKEDVKKEVAKPSTPKKPAVKFTKLARDLAATLPINVTFQGDLIEAKQTKATYSHSLKLDSAAKFALVNTYVIPDGQEFEGHQVIVLKPAPAFNFMKLPPEVRNRVYGFIFFTKGQELQPITLDGKRKSETKDPYAKSFAEGSKYRCAILAVSKEVNEEATPVLYARPLRFDTPATLMTFFAGLESRLRIYLRHIEIRQYVKKDAKTALAFLAEARNLEKLRIEVGVASDGDVTKTAKNFWADACKLLEAVGSRLEKGVVPVEKEKAKNPKAAKKEESSDDEDDDDDYSNESDDNEDESENSDDSDSDEEDAAQSKTPGSKDASSDVGKSDSVEETATDAPVTDTPADTSATVAEGANAMVVATDTPQDTNAALADAISDTKVPDGMKFDDGNMDGVLNPNNYIPITTKKDSKSPAPYAIFTAKKPARPQNEERKMRQGRKNDAIRILEFGRVAFKYKDKDKQEQNWSAEMKAKFLSELKAKLK